MSEFYVTFGSQYSYQPHPRFAIAHPDGWLTIVARGEEEARALAFDQLGERYSFIYGEDDKPTLGMYPRGELARWTA